MRAFHLFLSKNHYELELGVCENSGYFQSEKGEVTLRSGALVKLSKFIGYIEALFFVNNIELKLVAPIKWKGQLPKDVVKDRVKRLWPNCPAKNEHEYDAVGIGFNRIGLL